MSRGEEGSTQPADGERPLRRRGIVEVEVVGGAHPSQVAWLAMPAGPLTQVHPGSMLGPCAGEGHAGLHNMSGKGGLHDIPGSAARCCLPVVPPGFAGAP